MVKITEAASVKTSVNAAELARLGAVQTNDILYVSSADRAQRISTILYRDGALVAHAHVATHIDTAVAWPLKAHRTLVGAVILRLGSLWYRTHCWSGCCCSHAAMTDAASYPWRYGWRPRVPRWQLHR